MTEALNLSRAAISKAIKPMLEGGYIEAYQQADNQKSIFYRLTKKGVRLAKAHDALHKQSEAAYIEVFNHYKAEELAVVERFLADLITLFADKDKGGMP